MEKFKELFEAQKKADSSQKKILVDYSVEILKNFAKEKGMTEKKFAEEIASSVDYVKATQDFIKNTLMKMGFGETNVNYQRTKKYFPKSYDKSLVAGAQSPYMSLSGAEMATIARKAINKFTKEFGITPPKGY